MCTVTWLRRTDGYAVFFNRDEKKTRKKAHPPAVHTHNGIRYLASLDGEACGTWLAANEFGLTVGILNYYPAYATSYDSSRLSRGKLVVSLMDKKTVRAANDFLAESRMENYNPFFLFIIETGKPVLVHRWDGIKHAVKEIFDEDLPLTTSSFQSEAVIQRRKETLQAMKKPDGSFDEQILEAYHRCRDAKHDAFSVFMDRDDAQTVSISRLEVDPRKIEFSYKARDGEDCSVTLGRT